MTFRIHRIVRSVLILLTLGAATLLSGCKLAILNPKGAIAADETRLLIEATLTMLIVVVPAIVLTLVFAWRYSAKRDKGKYSPDFSHSNVLEAIWWAIPCAIIIVLATITWISTHHLDPYRPIVSKEKPITIQVVALNWKWLFIYPKQNIATVNFVEFPQDVPIEFQVTSDAPMNSFQITQLAGQIYAMAGMRTRIHMIANEPGDYRGLSTSYSGDGFSGMHFVARATKTKEQFEKWVKKVQQSPQHLSLKNYQELMKDSENNPVVYYSGVKKDLFNVVIMKYMDPKLQHLLPKTTIFSSNQSVDNHHAS